MLRNIMILLVSMIMLHSFCNTIDDRQKKPKKGTSYKSLGLSAEEIRKLARSPKGKVYRYKARETILQQAIQIGDFELVRYVDSLIPTLKFDMPFYPSAMHSQMAHNPKQKDLVRIYNYLCNRLSSKPSRREDCITLRSIYKSLSRLDSLGIDSAIYGYAKMLNAQSDKCKLQWISSANGKFHAGKVRPVIYKAFRLIDFPVLPHTPLMKSIRAKNFELAKFLTGQGIPLNHMSVFAGEVRSALAFSQAANDTSLSDYLIKAGAIADSWYELQIPDFMPDFPGRGLRDRKWIIFTKQGTTVKTHIGELPSQMMTVQTSDYLNSAENKFLFAIAGKKRTAKVHTVLSGPLQLFPDKPLSITYGPEVSSLLVEMKDTVKTHLVLEKGKARQILANWNRQDVLLWAGDLDGDKKIDLIYSSLNTIWYLMLSSFAMGEELVEQADACPIYGSHDQYMRERRTLWNPNWMAFPEREFNFDQM